MKKVLVIAALYGSKRVLSLAKHLPEYGWEPIIVTPPIDWQPTVETPKTLQMPDLPFDVIVTGYCDIASFAKKIVKFDTTISPRLQVKKLLGLNSGKSWVDVLFNLGGMFLNYPDTHRGWTKYAIKAGEKCIRDGGIDAILSICPVTSHIVASKLKEQHKILWIADFPDLWSQNYNYTYGKLRRYVDRKLEKKTMRNVDIITTSTPSLDKLKGLHYGKPVHTITFGYDSKEYESSHVELTHKFTITYTGTIYEGKQDPFKLLSALSELIANGDIEQADCDVRFYGQYAHWLDKKIQSLGLSSIVSQHRAIPHKDIMDIQKSSQILLLLDWDDMRETGAYTAKIFEYLGAGRPVLATGGMHGNAISDLIKETDAGIHAPTVGEVKNALLEYYQEYKSKGMIEYRGYKDGTYKYSQQEMAKSFAGLLSGSQLK